MTQPFPDPSARRGKRAQVDYQVVPPQQTVGYPLVPPPAPVPQAKARKWPWIAGIVVAFLFGLGIGGSGQQQPSSGSAGAGTPVAQPAQTVTVVAPAPAQPADQAVAEAPAPAPSSGPKTSFGDGTWVVGEDIEPGTYKSAGAQPGIMEFCAVSTHSGDTTDSPIIDIASANANEPIRIKADGKVKAVKASGCEDFVKVG